MAIGLLIVARELLDWPHQYKRATGARYGGLSEPYFYFTGWCKYIFDKCGFGHLVRGRVLGGFFLSFLIAISG